MLTASLTSVFDSAIEFGLTAEEILDAVLRTFHRLPADARDEFTEALAGALAVRLIEKQRG
jgi:hypothetical protein